MRHKLFIFFLTFLTIRLGAQENIFINCRPSLSPDGNTIFFSYDSDIWKVSTQGGAAERITSLQGEAINPRVSPDGQWLAFSSNQYGNYDVFVMPVTGGEIKQLTFHTAKDEIENWSWDSKTIYFTSDRSNGFASYSVSFQGDTPKRLFKNYFNTTVGIAETPSGEYIFTNSSEGAWQLYRKYYKGENNSDLLGYNPKTHTFKQYTNYLGEDFQPSIDINGNIYFVSDEENGEYNLYRIKNDKKEALTHFTTSIKSPYVAAQGTKVVFLKDFQLYLYDVFTGKSKPIEVRTSNNLALSKSQNFTTSGNISYFDISSDGKKIAFVSRGILFVSDIKGKFTRQITDGSERVMEVKWLKNNTSLLYNQTWQGYQNWFTIAADGTGLPKQLTNDKRNNRDIAIDSKSVKAVYLSGRDEVCIMDLANYKSNAIVKDEIWAFQNSKPSFAPNSEYVLYTARRNFEEDIFVYNLKTKNSTNLSNTSVSEDDPTWSPDGKYIYFASDRLNPSYPLGSQQSNIYRLALDWYDKPYKSTEFESLFKEDAKNDKDKSKASDSKDSIATPAIDISINPDGILDRIERISDRFGFQHSPQVFVNGTKTMVFFNARQSDDSTYLIRKIYENFEKPKTARVFKKNASNFTQNQKNIYFLSDGSIYKLEGEKSQPENIDIQFDFDKNLASEFRQMFEEAWAGVEENFYDDKFHGKNWSELKTKYVKFIPGITNRQDLRLLLNDMLGELNSSHLGFNSSGKEEAKSLTYFTNETGIIFNEDNPFVVDKILRKSPAYNKDNKIREGDKLVAVNNQKVNDTSNRNIYFTTPKPQEELTMEFDRKGTKIVAKVHPISNIQYKGLLYDEWIYNNRQLVDQWSKSRIAYAYMKNMSTASLDQFLLDMIEQQAHKDGLILDLRYNTGGNVHDKVLNFLSQRSYLQWKYREGEFTIQPNFAPSSKPIVLLINQFSLSDAEVTSAGFKALNLGKVIGTETYRWIIFTSAKGLVDGSSYRLPSWGVYTMDGIDLEKTGVKPDIYIKNTFLDLMDGKDPQLKKAVDEIMQSLK
jgi:tricorn protease